METNLTIITILISLVIIAVYLLRYLDGCYTIKSSEIIDKGNVTSCGKIIGRYYVIKTTYENNRIVITKSEHI